MKKVVSVLLLFFAAVMNMAAQDVIEPADNKLDTIYNAVDSLATADSTAVFAGQGLTPQKPKRDWSTWNPDIKRAMWLALVIPGAGQIYNRKFWKLPIIYGGIMGCIYAWTWNGQMYRDYMQAYKDIMDDDPNTKSYEDFLHNSTMTDAQKKTVLKNRKDRFRRYRDLSIFCLIGVYAVSVIDAYVDASLSHFDISEDLSLKVAPTYLNGMGGQMTASSINSLKSGGLGVRCQLNF